MLVAVINGGIRQGLITPRTGDTAGRAIRTVLLCAAILVLCWLTIGWMRPSTARGVWSIGALWVTLTLAFEFLAGHYVFGTPWSELLADYNVFVAASGCSCSSPLRLRRGRRRKAADSFHARRDWTR